jgi:hypothetical protein
MNFSLFNRFPDRDRRIIGFFSAGHNSKEARVAELERIDDLKEEKGV